MPVLMATFMAQLKRAAKRTFESVLAFRKAVYSNEAGYKEMQPQLLFYVKYCVERKNRSNEQNLYHHSRIYRLKTGSVFQKDNIHIFKIRASYQSCHFELLTGMFPRKSGEDLDKRGFP